MTNVFHRPTFREPPPIFRMCSVRVSTKQLMKAGRPGPPSILAPIGFERDGTFQQGVPQWPHDSKRHARTNAPLTAGIVAVVLERGAEGVDVAERRQILERARKQALPLKHFQ